MPVEPAAALTLLMLILFGTNFYAWYLIPVFALIALRIDRVGLLYVSIATTAGLAYYPMYVYAHFSTGWYRFQVHQFLALFLTVPAMLYVFLYSVNALIFRRKSNRHEPETSAQ